MRDYLRWLQRMRTSTCNPTRKTNKCHVSANIGLHLGVALSNATHPSAMRNANGCRMRRATQGTLAHLWATRAASDCRGPCDAQGPPAHPSTIRNVNDCRETCEAQGAMPHPSKTRSSGGLCIASCFQLWRPEMEEGRVPETKPINVCVCALCLAMFVCWWWCWWCLW